MVAALSLTVAIAGYGLLQPGRSGPFPRDADIAIHEHLLVPAQSILAPQDPPRPDGVPPKGDRPKGDRPNGDRANNDKPNGSIVTVLTEPVGGAWAAMGADMASVLDDGEALRVLPIIGKGSVQNLIDILRMRNVDAGFVLTDALPFVKTEYGIDNLEQHVRYIMKVFNSEVHIVARSEITSIRDLEGKKVFAERDTSYFAARNIFNRLHIKADIDFRTDGALGLQKLLNGEADAWIVSVGKVAPMIASIGNDAGLFHLVPIPYDKALQDAYLPSSLTGADYPNLIAPGATVDTLASSALLMVYNWPPGSERYNRVAKLVDALFSRIEQLQQPPRHPKWREAAIAATLPGLQRFKAAEDWLRLEGEMADADLHASVARRLLAAPAPGQRDLYRELLQLRSVNNR
jgi:TRAP-type uncharacterized transport system substrate-binding protein